MKLKQEPENEHDSNAVAIYTQAGNKLGNVPNFYSEAIFSLMDNGASPFVRVSYLNEKSHSHWWVKVDFECRIPFERDVKLDKLMTVMQ